ncbi:MAG: hypothetical protein ABL998_21525 [Planctomycetota bacterium]
MAHPTLPRRAGALALGLLPVWSSFVAPLRAGATVVGCADPFEPGTTVFVPYPRSLRLLDILAGDAAAFPPARREEYPLFVNGQPAFDPRGGEVVLARGLAALARDEELMLDMRSVALEVITAWQYGVLHEQPAASWHGRFARALRGINAVARETEVRGIRLLTGEWQRVWLFSRAPGRGPVALELGQITEGEYFSGVNVDDPMSALAAMDLIDAALDDLIEARTAYLVAEQELDREPVPGLAEVARLLQRMRANAVAAANGTLSTGERAPFDALYRSDLARLDTVAALTRSDTLALLEDGAVLLQGSDGESLLFPLHDLPNLSGTSTDTVTNATNSMEGVKSALAFVQAERERVTAARAWLEHDRLHVLGR